MGRKRSLKAHNKLLLDVINRQAGTLQKAILEAVMNSVEAGSPTVDIILECEGIEKNKPGARLIIIDKGRGFRNEQEIEEWFDTFGTPHDESEGKVWAQFRMGRGQCFAYGRNTWRTGEFQMVVDIDKMGLDYELDDGLEHHEGCRIEIDLYKNPIGTHNYPTVDKLKLEIKKQLEFMPGCITFNGEQVNTPPEECDWSYEDEVAYYLFSTGVNNFTYYNMGAFVTTEPATSAGVTGLAVSKQLLNVNFARNEIDDQCPVLAHIHGVMRENRIKKTRKTRVLDVYERQRLIADARDGTVEFGDVRGIQLIDLTNGKRMSPLQVSKIRIPWTFAPKGDMVADTLLVADRAVCFNKDILTRMGYTGDEKDFFEWLFRHYAKDNRRGGLREQLKSMKRCYLPFKDTGKGKDLSSGISRALIRLPQEKWLKSEKMIIRVLQRIGHYAGLKDWGGRTLCVGTAQTALAWTDGKTYICLARSYLKKLDFGRHAEGAGHLFGTMLHELAHTDSTEDGHDHGFGFLENFYRLCCDTGGMNSSPLNLVRWMAHELVKVQQEMHVEECQQKEAKAKAKRDKALGLTNPAKGTKKKPAAKKKAAKKVVKKKKVRRF